MAFWIASIALTIAVAVPLLMALLRPRGEGGDTAPRDLHVYRDQLREIDREVARGLVAGPEAERLRAEVARRVLDADRAAALGDAPGSAPRRATLLVSALVGVLILGAVWAYVRLGAPGYPDMPIAARIAMADDLYRNRPSQEEAAARAASRPAAAPAPDADFLALMDRLRTALQGRPDDLEGHRLLARNEAALGHYETAIAAQRRVLAIRGTGAGAEDHAALAELMILAAGGFVSAEAEAVLTEALRLDPQNGTALYYAGLMFGQVGRPDRTFALWAPLLQRSAPGDPWVVPIRAEIGRIAAEAGETGYVPPPEVQAPVPDMADIEAARDLSPEARRDMIAGMVEQLSDRLAREGGPAGDWARLIQAYGVLGETDRARGIWTEAQGRFAARPDDMSALRAAAEAAGLVE